MKKIIFFITSAVVGITLFVGVILKVGLPSIWQTIVDFSFAKWFVILFLYALAFFITQYRWYLILRSLGQPVKLSQILPAKIVGFSVDYITPSPNVGGEAIRAMVLKKDAGVPLSDGLASVIIDKLMDFSYALPFLLFSIFYVLIKFSLSWKLIAGLLFISLLFIFLIAFFYYRTLRARDFFGSIIRFFQLHKLSFVAKVMDKIGAFELIVIKFFRHDRRTLYRGLGLSVLGGIVTLSAMWSIMLFLGLPATFLDVILVSTLTVVTFLLPIPGSFGSTETGEALIFSLIGFSPESGVAFSLIFRSVDFLKVVIGLLFLSHFGIKIGQTLFSKAPPQANGNGQNGHPLTTPTEPVK
ncbi:MAG: lysylphosphatidylglycerol synthase transmembrane domain-containing protein [Patescibacteria group bacterium]